SLQPSISRLRHASFPTRRSSDLTGTHRRMALSRRASVPHQLEPDVATMAVRSRLSLRLSAGDSANSSPGSFRRERRDRAAIVARSEEQTSELHSRAHLVCLPLLA